ncbi:hypothetical protein HYW20_05195 [Candidatus Woesearchaeota archaeon]|nr:hypothetical protein [Candidatus Woesearchaeota archaeon]
MKSDYIVYGALAVAVLILFYSIYGLTAEKNEDVPTAGNNPSPGFKMISTGSTDQGSVQIDLTPRGFANSQLQVDFAVNTHSVELGTYALEKITTLEYGGKKISPINAPKLEGHHSSGALAFNVIEKFDKFRIIIKGIPNVEERVFEWN